MKMFAMAAAAALVAGAAFADGHATTKLRIQTHYAPETTSGSLLTELFENIELM